MIVYLINRQTGETRDLQDPKTLELIPLMEAGFVQHFPPATPVKETADVVTDPKH